MLQKQPAVGGESYSTGFLYSGEFCGTSHCNSGVKNHSAQEWGYGFNALCEERAPAEKGTLQKQSAAEGEFPVAANRCVRARTL
ncbi:MAG: hypothetical protein ACLRVB_01950 [Blautia sp.]